MNEIIIAGTLDVDGWLDLMKRVYDPQGIAPALNTMQGGGRHPKIIEKENDMRVRKLTPKECWKLMGFTSEDYEKAKAVCSETQLYKQAGNSIVVQVLESIIAQMLPDNKDEVQ